MAKMIFIPEVATEVERTYTTNGNYNINVGNAISKLTIITKVGQPKLYTPIISLSGNTLYISDSDNGYFASSYDIYYGASLPHNVSRGSSTSTTTEVNLQTFITTSGTYTITVVAKANNFVDSDESDSVSYTVATSGYSVSCSEFYDPAPDVSISMIDENNNIYNITGAGEIATDVKKVKFNITFPAVRVPEIGTYTISSEKLGGNILTVQRTTSAKNVTSIENTLTQNIDDLKVEFGI